MSDDEAKETYDWSAHYDAEGNLYYHNEKTDETTWDAPEKFNPPEKDDDDNKKEENAATEADTGTWEKHTDGEGQVYYYNEKTEETTWEKPDGFKDEEEPADAVGKQEVEETALPSSPVGEDSFMPSSPVGGPDKEEDNEDGDGDVKMEEATKETGEWEKHEDDEGQVYYHNTATDETSWERPEGFQSPKEDKDDMDTDEAKKKGSWEKVTDDEGQVYYYNSVTEETTWDKPDDYEEEGTSAVKQEDEATGDGESSPKKKGSWEKVTDDEGQVYYYNAVTEETSWDKPDDYEEAATAVKEEADTTSSKGKSDWVKHTDDEGQVYYYNEKTEETTWEKPDDYEEGDGDAATPAAVKSEPSEEVAAASGGGGGWEKLTDGEGREYYFHTATETTQWEKPDDYVEGASQSPKPDDPVSSKRKWEKLTDGEGREYYYSAATDTTQWEKPDDYVEESISSPKVDTSTSKGASGWEKYTDEEGRIYYFNAGSGETQWDAPDGFVDQDEKKADEDNEFASSPVARSPSPMSEEEEEKEPEPEAEPEPEPEPEIDPAIKRVMDAEEALAKTDSVMEPGCTANVLEVVQSQDGNPEKAIKALIENYQGTTAICGIIAKWLADLRASSMKVKDVNAVVGTATQSVADGIRNTAQDIVSLIAKEKFTTARGEVILKLSKSEAAFLGQMIKSSRWRKLLIDLAAKNKGDALLMYCIRTISKQGFHRELVKRMNPSEYFTVFNAMLQSEVSVVGKTAISASNDVDTSIGLEELVNDLRRTCTSTAYTYLYSIEFLRHLVTMAEEDEADTHGTKRTRFRRAIRKWERLSEDLDFAMVDPSTSLTTAGSSVLARKRRLDVALTISELHQRQRRRLKPSEDEDIVIVSNGDGQKRSIETGLLAFLKRYAVGTQVDDKVLDALLPTGLNMQATAVEVGELLITYPLAIRALLSHMFKTGGTTRVPPSTKSKCARLVALAVLASEKKARAEIGESADPEDDSPDEVALTRMLTQGSQLCEDLSLTASFVVTRTGKERGALVSPGQTLCNLALRCACVAQGVMIWADDCIKQNDFTASATYPTFSPSILTIVRIVANRHPCTRLEAAEIAFTFLRHSTSGEMSYKKINEIKEQCIRLLLFVVVHGEAPAVLQTFITQLQQAGEVLKMDGSLLRYLVTGMLDVVKPPISLVFVRLFGAVLKTPRCIDALLSVYFKPEYKSKLKTLLLHFHKACSPDIGTATPADLKLVGHLIRTYSVTKK